MVSIRARSRESGRQACAWPVPVAACVSIRARSRESGRQRQAVNIPHAFKFQSAPALVRAGDRRADARPDGGAGVSIRARSRESGRRYGFRHAPDGGVFQSAPALVRAGDRHAPHRGGRLLRFQSAPALVRAGDTLGLRDGRPIIAVSIRARSRESGRPASASSSSWAWKFQSAPALVRAGDIPEGEKA